MLYNPRMVVRPRVSGLLHNFLFRTSPIIFLASSKMAALRGRDDAAAVGKPVRAGDTPRMTGFLKEILLGQPD